MATPATSPSREPDSEARALELFAQLAAELEEGRGDPQAFFASHPEHERRLRELHRGWIELDLLLQSTGQPASIVTALRAQLAHSGCAPALERLAQRDFAAHYAISEELGRGGMGVVYRVVDRVLGRDLAMKVLRSNAGASSARLLQRFLDEAATIGRLEHPGIVPIHELGLDSDGRVYFTMPLVRGLTLGEILAAARQGRDGWSRARVLEVLLKVCDAVAYAHSRGVLHRDLKPANVMVGRFGEVYVMDWGLARAAAREELGPAGDGAASDSATREALTLEGEVLGTPAYMAPEQALSSSSDLDERCDVYALGAVLYELLAGERPFGELGSADALHELRRRAPASIAELSHGAEEELVAIAARAMARDREQRYASVVELGADLRAFLEGRVVRAHRTGAWVEAHKWIARNKKLAAALATAFLALAGGLVATVVLLQRAERERNNVFRLAQSHTLANLVERADRLWPALPERIEELRAWLADAGALVLTLDGDAADGTGGLRAQLAELRERRARWSTEDEWWHGELEKLVTSIEQLAERESGLLGDGVGRHGWGVARRLACAEREREELATESSRSAWAAASAGVRADPRFGGLELGVQPGLVPLGRDPRSGLWEFAVRATGDPPTRAQDGALVFDAQSAIVLVLVPGDGEGLAPFLVGKHEITQAQWLRVTGNNPSFHRDEPGASAWPVEQVNWFEATEQLARLGLRLPTRSEWGHALHAGTATQYFWGDERAEFHHYANVRDASYSAESNQIEPFEPQHDGYSGMAPAGRFRPNGWGLHDMVGNAFEWCADRLNVRDEGGRKLEESDARLFLGGSYQRPLDEAHAESRGGESPSFAYRSVGVRPVADVRSR